MTTKTAASDLHPLAQEEVSRLAALAEVRSAFAWFRTHESRLAEYQMEVARIAAPPFGEAARSAWLADRFREYVADAKRGRQVRSFANEHGAIAWLEEQ